MPKIKRVHHIAVVVEDIEKALSFWRDGLGLTLEAQRDVPQEKAQVAFLPVGDTRVELVQPAGDDSGIARFLAKRGPGMHHVCLEVQDLEGMLAQLRAKGVRLVHETPQSTSTGRRYAFIHPESAGGVLVELYEQ